MEMRQGAAISLLKFVIFSLLNTENCFIKWESIYIELLFSFNQMFQPESCLKNRKIDPTKLEKEVCRQTVGLDH